jgi:hypothetical protein
MMRARVKAARCVAGKLVVVHAQQAAQEWRRLTRSRQDGGGSHAAVSTRATVHVHPTKYQVG